MKGAMVLLLLTGVVFPLVVGYHVDPVKSSWSGWTPSEFPNNFVSQVLTINFDELDSTTGAYCELFAGTKGGGGAYHVSVLSYPGGAVIATGDVGGNVDHKWVKFNLGVRYPDSIVKGKKLEFRFTRGGGDSIQYYYDEECGYGPYGQMIAPYPPPSLTTGLAMRCYGRMNPVSDVWRACTNHGYDPARGGAGDTTLAKAESMGVRWLRDDFMGWAGWESDSFYVKGIHNWYRDSRFSMVGILCGGSSKPWQSSKGSGTGDPTSYPPRYLWAESGQTNYWAKYCHDIMVALPKVRYWEIWPETNNDTFYPDSEFYRDRQGGPIDTPRELCSLYVRMCRVAESTAHELGAGSLGMRKIVGGSPLRLVDSMVGGARGVEWLDYMFDIAKGDYGAAESCFDIVSTHPYMWDWGPGYFWQDVFESNLDTTRWVMRQAGYPGMELWATEYGWPRWWVTWHTDTTADTVSVTDTLLQADDICKFYTSAIARQADPRGGYDRAIHYELTSHHFPQMKDNNGFGLLESLGVQPRVPVGWAFTQESLLTGLRLNGRVMTGDTVTDSLVWTYEFEDASGERTWVCWADSPAAAIVTPVPVRNDEVDTVALDYTGSESTYAKDAEQSGWLSIALQPRPAFVMETGAASRPDLVVDSVRYIPPPESIAVLAWVTNRGNRATPHQSPGNEPYPTWAVLYANGDALAQQVYTDSIAMHEQVMFTFHPDPAQTPDAVLFSVRVNPGQSYVELGTDDNSGYRLSTQP